MSDGFATPSLGRLKKRSEFLRAARNGSKWATAGLVLQVLRRPAAVVTAEPSVAPANPANQTAPVRVGFTASRKVGGAVQRNRAKRRLRALTRELLPDRAKPGRDYVLIARQGTLTRSFPALRADLEQALERAERPRGARRQGSRP